MELWDKSGGDIYVYAELVAQSEQEPVAWEQFHEHMVGSNYVAPQRTWVGLTDEEKHQCIYDEQGYVLDYEDCVDKTEAKLKEKNT